MKPICPSHESKHLRSLVVLLGVSFLLCPKPSQAWSSVGHKTVAYIAADHLTPAAKQHIQAILGTNQDLAAIATWADDIRPHRPQTKPWHYIDLPVRTNVSLANLSQYCAANDLLAQVGKNVTALQGATGTTQLEALKFLVHFVGDTTMPLHCADDNDRGGNEKLVRFYGPSGMSIRGNKMKLHALWDHLIQVEAKEDPRTLATRLDKYISESDIKTWAKGKPEDWVLDTFNVSKHTVYTDLPPGPTPQGQEWKLSRRYYSKMRPVANTQLEKAGIRLAYILNSIYDPSVRTSDDNSITLTDEKVGTGFAE